MRVINETNLTSWDKILSAEYLKSSYKKLCKAFIKYL